MNSSRFLIEISLYRRMGSLLTMFNAKSEIFFLSAYKQFAACPPLR